MVVALIRLLVPFSIKSVTSIYSLLQSIYSDINPVRTAQTTTFLPIHGNMPEIANGIIRGYGTENRIHFDFECNMAGRSVTLFWIFCGFLYKMLSGISIFAACWKWYFGSMEGKTSTKKESIHPADRNHSCTLSYGVIRPVILMPKNTEWKNIYQLRYVLEHEYVHIRRLDMLTKLIMIAAVCIHWFILLCG